MLGNHQFNMYYQDGGYPEEIIINFDKKDTIINSLIKSFKKDKKKIEEQLIYSIVDFIDEDRQNKDYEYDVYCCKYNQLGKLIPHVAIIAISLDIIDEQETLGNIIMFSDLILKKFLESKRFQKACGIISDIECHCVQEPSSSRGMNYDTDFLYKNPWKYSDYWRMRGWLSLTESTTEDWDVESDFTPDLI